MSPRDPLAGAFHVDLGDEEINLCHFDAAFDAYRKALNSGYRPFFAYTDLAAAYAHAGRMGEAKAATACAFAFLEPFLGSRLDGYGYASGHQRTRTGPFFPET